MLPYLEMNNDADSVVISRLTLTMLRRPTRNLTSGSRGEYNIAHDEQVELGPRHLLTVSCRSYTKVLIHPNGPIASAGEGSSKSAGVWGEGGKGIRSVEKTIKSWV